MLLKVVRAVFVLLVGIAAWWVTTHGVPDPDKASTGMGIFYGICAALAAAGLVCVDIAFRRQFLRGFVSVVFGLIMGILVSVVVLLLLCAFLLPALDPEKGFRDSGKDMLEILQPMVPLVALTCCYLTVSVVLRTKDEFRFVIPYIDFAEQGRTSGGMVLDSSVLIDGRIADIAEKLLTNDALIVPRMVIDEMQKLADNPDRLLRERGRRGLDMVGRLQANPRLHTRVHEDEIPGGGTVDARLVRLAQMLGSRLATNDLNLAKVARIERVDVININDLAGALRAPYLPGDALTLRMVRPGEQRGQGVGYLDDGTMVVVENARDDVGKEIAITITNSLQTPAGRMIFARKTGDVNLAEEPPKKPDSTRIKNGK